MTKRGTVLLVAAMSLAQGMVFYDVSAIGIALPEIRKSLDVHASTLPWVVNAYVVAYAACIAVAGRLSDTIGARTTFVIGSCLFLAGSALAGATPLIEHYSTTWLIAARIVQGMGGALVMPTTLAIALQVVPEEQHGRVTSYVVAGAQAIFVLGPLLGGLLVEHVSWRAVFYLALPAGLVSLVIVRAVPWSEAKATRGSAGLLSYAGLSMLLASGLSFFVFGLQEASGAAGFDVLSLVTMGIGLVLMVVFVVRNLGASRPLLPLDLFGTYSYVHFSIAVACAQMFAVAICVFIPQTLQTEFGVTPSAAGVILLAFVGGWMAMVPVAGRLYDKVGPANLLLVGPAITLAGFVAFDLASRGSTVSAIMPWLFLCGLGVGLTILPSYVGAISAGAQTDRASVIGLTQTVRQMAGSLAIAVLSGAFVLPHAVKVHGYAAVKGGYFLIMLLLTATVAFNGACWLVQRLVRREADVTGSDNDS